MARDDRAARRGRGAGRGATRAAHERYLAGARGDRARCPRSRGSPPAACPTGSSACTSWPASRWPRGAGSTRSATRSLDAPRAVVGHPAPASSESPRRRDRDAGSPRSTAAPTRSSCWSPTSTRRPARGRAGPRRSRMVRLGQDVDRTGRLAAEALERVFAAVEEYAAPRRASTASDAVRFCATSPRPATPRTPRTSSTASSSGWACGPRCCRRPRRPRCPSPAPPGPRGRPGRDAGARGRHRRRVHRAGARRRHGVPSAARSLDVGSVRLTERYLRARPAPRGGGRPAPRRRSSGSSTPCPARASTSGRRAHRRRRLRDAG